MEKKPKPPSLRHRLTHLDTTLSLHIHTICQPFPRPLLKALEISGDGLFWIPIPIALFFTPLASKSVHVRFLLVGLFIGFLFDLILVGLIKYLVRRPRPVYNTGIHLTFSVDHWSFPSGHSSRVCFIAAFLYLSMETVYQAVVQLKSSGNRFFSETIDPDAKFVMEVHMLLQSWVSQVTGNSLGSPLVVWSKFAFRRKDFVSVSQGVAPGLFFWTALSS
ncbi:PREDICTED: probable lipid phosphate phosphatase beta isoform X1 [Nelumbo nucifera]|uniref:Probable lipid phosphate phosphatase beta isoform X1 n=1 Tax=Nelumbo nucifera TaxID=4432 RepID=A0A1U8A2I5_NELNU|nr:PREDICTED: probable lipid phosphate phosphatase beta isoform X1 [Nelumbo nucifera]